MFPECPQRRESCRRTLASASPREPSLSFKKCAIGLRTDPSDQRVGRGGIRRKRKVLPVVWALSPKISSHGKSGSVSDGADGD